MSSLGLLVFTRNDGERAASAVRQYSGSFDEVVVVDSSDPEPFERLNRALPADLATIYRVLPVGDVDLLRPYGAHQICSDRVLVLDSDETLSEPLLAALPNLTAHEAYVIPRRETGLGAYTYHLRLYPPGRVRFGPRSWEYPLVDGSVATLRRAECLVHSADFDHYLDREDRARRCLPVESYERPFTREYARRAFPPLAFVTGRDGWETPLSRPAIETVLGLEFAQDVVCTGSVGLARFHLAYARAKRRYLDQLSESERARRREIHRQIRTAGGLIRYIGFDVPAYVDRLSAGFPWNLDGPRVLERLIDHRYRYAQPMETWTDG